MKKYLSAAIIIASTLVAGSAFAQQATAIDVSAVTAGIKDASVALLSVIGALMGLSVGIFGITKVYRFVSKKAGA